MNFTRKIKEELASVRYPSACCYVACLSAFLRTSGSIMTKGSQIGFSFFTESATTAAYFEEIMKDMFDADGSRSDGSAGSKEKHVVSYISPFTAGILAELGVMSITPEGISVEMGIDKYLIEGECCKKAYLAGAFLGGGSCTLPTEGGAKNTGYHMEFVFSYYETAHAFSELLAEFDILAKLIQRKGSFVVYVKSNDEIQEILSLIGAENCSLAMAETVVIKDYNNKVNRKLNCDLGNISKQIAAAERQKEAIKLIEQTVGLGALKEELAVLCRLRLEDDPLTLEEIAERLGLSKSCVNHRLRKIMEIAEELKG